MDNRPIAATIRSKKLGILIQSARSSAGKSIEECAAALNIPSDQMEAFESGDASPSLPELEALAFYLRIPLDYFWGREVLDEIQKEPQVFEKDRLMRLRNRGIGASLRKARLEAGITSLELANTVSISEEQLNKYELGAESVPLPELELLANNVNTTIKDFQDSRGPIGTWIKQQRAMKHFDDLSPELQDFISKPIQDEVLHLALKRAQERYLARKELADYTALLEKEKA